MLTGGEDHSLVAAFPPSDRAARRWRVIGAVHAGAGVTVGRQPRTRAPGLATLPLTQPLSLAP